ncbi:UDP-glycosyltransferase [Quillaja saponaria]|uniref:UDP-glycosyltransferase n=1 Tax=Quillaja saponaria TaxID=32244 RepID=A0AAD7LE76_QUISA|nr:UDP-glycosyltransferase [Quillaja saponaria]
MSTTTDLHILIYPFPTSGHIIPFLDLTNQLLTRSGLYVTVLVTPQNLPLLDPLLAAHPSSLQSLVLPPPEFSNPKQNRLFAIIQSMRQLHYPLLLQWFQSHPSPPVAIISDFFLGWTHQLGSQLRVPRLVFSPSGAFALSITHLYRQGKKGDPDWDFIGENFIANMACWGIVFNSFSELERVYFNYLKQELGHDRVFAVGPALPPPEDEDVGQANRGGSSSVPCHEVLSWLNDRPDDSVVYICFGSRTVLTSKQMEVLTAALEISGVHFILSVREPDERHVGDDHGVIPDGFEDRVGGRGFVIRGWAPQVSILRHRAVGGFMTHCGWNSVLEGLSAGAVMLTWPMGADQYTNAKLLVDQLGVAIRGGEGTENIPESSELAQKFVDSVDAIRPERVRARELRDAALGSVKGGGSSNKELDELVKQLRELKS